MTFDLLDSLLTFFCLVSLVLFVECSTFIQVLGKEFGLKFFSGERIHIAWMCFLMLFKHLPCAGPNMWSVVLALVSVVFCCIGELGLSRPWISVGIDTVFHPIALFHCASPVTGEALNEEEDPFNAPVEESSPAEGTDTAAPADDGFGDDMFDAPVDANATGGDGGFSEEFTSGGGETVEPEPAPEPAKESAQLVFNRKFRAIVEERDAAEQAKKQERLDRAEGELAQWRSMRDERREKVFESNRSAEKELFEEQKTEKESSSPWAQVVKSIDTQATSVEDRTDAARMRSVLIQLKNHPLKPPQSAAEPAE